MKTEKEELVSICPYFSKKLKACGLSTEGIYLPPRIHVLTFCLTSRYTECSIYTRFIPLQDECSHADAGREANRRRFPRIEEKRRVLIRTCSPEGIVVGEFAEMASTIDYSQKGMRITIDRHIPRDSLLLFDFDMDFVIPRLQGFAQLCWHRKAPMDPHKIEAGLVFKDEYSQKVLSMAMANSGN